MLEEKGIVIAVEDNLIWVQTEIKTTCGSCQAKDNCGTSAIAKAFSAKPNVISLVCDEPVHQGDRVIIGIDEGFVVKSSFYLYMLPIAGFLLFALLAQWLFADSASSLTELVSAGTAFFGGWLGWLMARKVLSKLACRDNCDIRLLKVESDHIKIQMV